MKEIIESQAMDKLQVWKKAAETNCVNVDEVAAMLEEKGFTAAVDFPFIK
jgi:hypothetical protein